eukprot:TRINITY_DN0_c2434_g1_i1.p1 TRINITY_DN0_c2434_g1~~TRINITY_DN0_c2434_g1_i1.p1  ORF type:complete len:156 (-),score=50.83 TRINITY_DN0_c2434_g1_i1:98-565(-)
MCIRDRVQIINYAIFTIFTVFLASAAVSFFNKAITFYIISAVTGAILGNTIYTLSTKPPYNIPGAVLYILAGVSIFYMIFIIFFNVPILTLAIIGIVVLLVGFFILYDVNENIAGTSYNLEGRQSAAGSIICWLDYALIVVRICEAFTRAMRKSP